MFSESFLQSLILVAIIWTALGVVTLLVLFLVDWWKGTLW